MDKGKDSRTVPLSVSVSVTLVCDMYRFGIHGSENYKAKMTGYFNLAYRLSFFNNVQVDEEGTVEVRGMAAILKESGYDTSIFEQYDDFK